MRRSDVHGSDVGWSFRRALQLQPDMRRDATLSVHDAAVVITVIGLADIVYLEGGFIYVVVVDGGGDLVVAVAGGTLESRGVVTVAPLELRLRPSLDLADHLGVLPEIVGHLAVLMQYYRLMLHLEHHRGLDFLHLVHEDAGVFAAIARHDLVGLRTGVTQKAQRGIYGYYATVALRRRRNYFVEPLVGR